MKSSYGLLVMAKRALRLAVTEEQMSAAITGYHQARAVVEAHELGNLGPESAGRVAAEREERYQRDFGDAVLRRVNHEIADTGHRERAREEEG